MKLLLDTQIVVQAALGERASARIVEAFESDESDLLVSVVSVWEIAIKRSLERLDLPMTTRELFLEVRRAGVRMLPMKPAHALAVEGLPFHHRDPFDRLLVAACLAEDLAIVSTDRVFDRYGVRRVR